MYLIQGCDNLRNLDNIAIALKYKAIEDKAPKIVAKGKGVVATKIIKKAEDNNVVIHKDSKLVKELSGIDIGNEIPIELYEVVAGILAFVYELDEEKEYNEEI